MTHVTFTPGATRLERRNACARIDAVGLQEHFDQFCAELTRRFGWDLGQPAVREPDQPGRGRPSRFRMRIADDNADDIELYEFARERVRARGA